jgi:hypothetical protein
MPLNSKIKKTLVIGSGPIIIGQAAEFDYAGTQACLTLKEFNIEVVLINSNPATIMTDHNIADHIYIEPLNIETIEKFCNSLKAFRMAVSWGGHESLIIPKCAGIKQADFDVNNPTHRLIRLYIGLEEPDFLIKDLSKGFSGI